MLENILMVAMNETAKLASNIGVKFLITAGTTATTCIVNKAIDDNTAKRAQKLYNSKGAITEKEAKKLTTEGIVGKSAASGSIAALGLAAMYYAGKAIDASK